MITAIHPYLLGLLAILTMMICLWLVSIILKNVSIVDIFWGAGYVLASIVYFYFGDGLPLRKLLVLILVAGWGFRLSVYLAWRNIGKGEDFRYKQFRKNYGEHRYWWVSFFQTFLLQGILTWLVSAPIFSAMNAGRNIELHWLDFFAACFWLFGFAFESVGDFQLAKFKDNPANKNKILDKGLWRYTRHPNYFGDAMVWWGFGFFALATASYLSVLGAVLMTLLLLKVSGVALLEKSLKVSKPAYADYMKRTSAFIPWFPKQ